MAAGDVALGTIELRECPACDCPSRRERIATAVLAALAGDHVARTLADPAGSVTRVSAALCGQAVRLADLLIERLDAKPGTD